MANKNKNTNNLVPSSDNETTAEYEVRSLLQKMRAEGPEIEVDAATFDINDQHAAQHGYTGAELRAALAEETASVENFRFEVEQLSSRQRGLEEEIKTRIEIADSLNAAVREVESRLSSAQQDIEEKQASIERLSSDKRSLAEKLEQRTSINDELKTSIATMETRLQESLEKSFGQDEQQLSLQANLDSKQKRIEQFSIEQRRLENELQARTEVTDELKSRVREIESRLEESSHQITVKNQELQSLQQGLENKQDSIKQFSKTQQKLENELEARANNADELLMKFRDTEQRLDNSLQQITTHNESRQILQVELAGKQELVEQLSSKRRGLEIELKARTEIADELKLKVKDIDFRLDASLKQLADREQALQSLQIDLERAQKSKEQLKDRSDALESTAKTLKEKIRALENALTKKEKQIASIEKSNRKTAKRIAAVNSKERKKEHLELSGLLKDSRTEIAELRTYIDGRQSEWANLESGFGHATDQLAVNHAKIEDLTTELDARNSQLIRSREQYISASDSLTKQKAQVRKLRTRIKGLETALYEDASKEIEACRYLIEKQQGELDGQSHAFHELRIDRDRFAGYADSLRMQLQDQVSISKVSVAMREKLEVGLEAANATIGELADRCLSEQERGDQLDGINRTLQEDFDSEVKKIHLELRQAKELIAGHLSTNEQLVSDLADNRDFQEALESQLDDVENESNKSVAALALQLKKARQDANELEQNLRSKDSAISELMQELERRSDAIELDDEIGGTLQKIDGFKSDDDSGPYAHDRDRIARLLIGDADGKKLRFPLFKNRLTIGRTAHNDIQLNMHYISRRHAVISTDHGQTRIIDWGSKNGVFVNDLQVTEKILQSGDVVTIGTTEFRYEEHLKR